MAIPKEPRQLMINIMYLVLTALLALNVSAEIFNAFKVVENGLKESNKNIQQSNSELPEAIRTAAQKDLEVYQTYIDRLTPVRQYSSELTEKIDEMITSMIDRTGNENGVIDDEDYTYFAGVKELKGKKDKDVTTKYLVDDGQGEALKGMINEYRGKFLDMVDEKDRVRYESIIPMQIDDETWRSSRNRNTWAEFNFKQMPLQAALPILYKLKNDVIGTESAILNYYFNKIGGSEDLVMSSFRVVSAPKKSYVIRGETYEADIFLSATTKDIENMTVTVGGRSLPVTEGVAEYRAAASATGRKTYTATIEIINPVTDKPETMTGSFEYEVGVRSATVSADKMNVFYMGVDNPISVSAAGVSTNELQVTGAGSGIQLTAAEPGKYNVRVSQQGTTKITLSGGGLEASTYDFRCKRIPNPEARVGNKPGGSLGTGELKAQQGVAAILENFDFDARCAITGYRLVRAPKRQDVEFAANAGAVFGQDSRRLISRATPGDRFFFEDVIAKCPGDKAGRRINDMVFTIK